MASTAASCPFSGSIGLTKYVEVKSSVFHLNHAANVDQICRPFWPSGTRPVDCACGDQSICCIFVIDWAHGQNQARQHLKTASVKDTTSTVISQLFISYLLRNHLLQTSGQHFGACTTPTAANRMLPRRSDKAPSALTSIANSQEIFSFCCGTDWTLKGRGCFCFRRFC